MTEQASCRVDGTERLANLHFFTFSLLHLRSVVDVPHVRFYQRENQFARTRTMHLRPKIGKSTPVDNSYFWGFLCPPCTKLPLHEQGTTLEISRRRDE